MESEQCRVPRKRPSGLSDIQFEAESGGIVLDASEEGSCLPGWRPVQQQGPIRLYISPNHSGLY